MMSSSNVSPWVSSTSRSPSLVWLEQTSRGVFARHTLEVGKPYHATLDVGDFDHDGDIDIVVGNFVLQPKPMDWVDVWENHRFRPESTR